MERSEVAIIIPAFNEEVSIADVVTAALVYASVIVVDDCSKDATALLAKEAGAIVVLTTENQGYDGALNKGFSEADRLGFNYAITFDADGQHNPQWLTAFITHLQQGNELVLGIRPHFARFGEWLFSFYALKRFAWQDPLCGMKGYRLSLYRERGWFDSYQSIGTELALYGLRNKKKTIQIPIPIKPRVGHSRFGAAWKANVKIICALWLSIFR